MFTGAIPLLATAAMMAMTAGAAAPIAPELLGAGEIAGGALGAEGALGAGALEAGSFSGPAFEAGSGISGLDAASTASNYLPNLKNVYQGYKLANNAYNFAQNPNNVGAGINAAKGAYQLGSTLSAAQGGLMASGGVADLGSYSDGGRLLKGPGDGMSDNIPAKIWNAQPARLADGEFVIPADVVSHLGNGSTDAGAKQLYKMMDRIRHARTGNKKQGKQINASKFLPQG